MEPDAYPSARQQLGVALRELRTAAGLTGTQAADRAAMSQPKISKFENGRLLPSVADLDALLDVYRAAPAQRVTLQDLARRLRAPVESNRSILRRGADHRQHRIGEFETAATTLRYLATNVIPGLVQTPAYVRTIFGVELAGEALERAVAARQARQQALHDAGKAFTFVLTEAALRWRLLPDADMVDQLDHLSRVAERDNVELVVVPFTARVPDVPLVGYQIFDDRLATVGVEHAVVAVTDPRDIAAYTRMLRLMYEAALIGVQARAYLATIREDYRRP